MNKQPELTALTRKTLIDTYFDIISKGEKATVGAITTKAGFNRCTFYRYFTDTEQLLNQVEAEICGAFQSVLSQASLPILPLEIIEAFSDIYKQYGNYISVLLGENGDVRFARKIKAVISPFAKQIIGDETDSDEVAELKVEFILSAVLALVTKWYDMKQPIPISHLGMIIKDLLHQ